MTTTDPASRDGGPPPGCPAHAPSAPTGPIAMPARIRTDTVAATALYSAAFAEDPAAIYTELRRQGTAGLVELSPGVTASLVIGYEAALAVLRDPENFPRDPRRWQQTMAPDCPVLPMMQHRQSAVFNDGEVHRRLRSSVTDSLDRIDPTTLRKYVERSADTLIDDFADKGEADLLAEYARLLPILVFNQLLDCPPHLSASLVRCLAAIFEGGAEAAEANQELGRCMLELITLRQQNPGNDLLSWLISHPHRLDTQELMDQLTMLLAGGIEPVQNLIANALRLLLSDARFAGDLSGGSLPVDDALVEILWTDPPLANFGPAYPTEDVRLPDGTVLPAGRPVVVSYAAANIDPNLAGDRGTGNRAHLAWSAGPHTCPGQSQARIIASLAIEKVLDRLPDVELALPEEDLRWRLGPFQRALTALPVRFPPVAVPEDPGGPVPTAPIEARAVGGSSRQAADPPSGRPTATAPQAGAPGGRARTTGPRWMSALVRWWRGQ
ncbi:MULTISPECIES: cytochrome P450 [Actinoalloteichus]|uniref:Cytochrome P450 n=1 Tax=Actinoalloteichus fjordicus TaxID=1612552 RepID=A0AAC9PTI8_9PSEU|nr:MULTISPECIES: cytochrome P450 [Actinoalloteichus]APU16087.1 cytochrome P450 [Actinoalloteichus fjordicus]APU22152.1 cytochrome P450 [Actinoalloteichus sp. GBA129-24]